ncbi:MAG: EAL domain-containing protein [Pseudomonadota bacterium]|nr:EAL domain-containing protein [Pseudomonadota bacterium]
MAHAIDSSPGDALHDLRLFEALWETTTHAVLVIDTCSIIRHANPGTLGMLGYSPDCLQGRSLEALMPSRIAEVHGRGFAAYLEGGARSLNWRSTEMAALHRNGHEVPVEITFSEIQRGNERLFVGFLRDITERKRAQAALLEEKERARAALHSIADGVVTTDLSGRITFVNAVAEHLTGWTHAESLGRDWSEIVSLSDERGNIHRAPDQREMKHRPDPITDSTMLVRRDGHALSIEGTVAPILDSDKQIAGTVMAFRNVTVARKLTAELAHQASHDSLTGLVNRKAFERRVLAAVATAIDQGHVHSLLYLDLDQFKVVNDTSGHIAGDELLRQLAGLLQHQLREHDTLARLGGDEFGVLLENCAPDDALRVAEKLRAAVADFSFAWQDRTFNVGVSVGLVNFHDGAMTLIDILSRADEACYVAKSLGRNRIHAHRPDDQALAVHHSELEWIAEVTAALEQHRLFLCSQPIVAVDEPGRVTGHVEVLLRMMAPSGAVVPPMAFIPAAERYELMPTLDRWVLRAVCDHIFNHPESGTVYAINLSVAALTDDDFADFVRDTLSIHAVAPSMICFEIAETVAIANLGDARRLITRLRELGCSFALDDFGSGLSSFGYLKHLPVVFLKIDGTLVRDIVDDPIDYAVVEAINRIAHLMGLRTIAEFVENDEILEKLRVIGVDFAQGHGVARPQTLERAPKPR